MLVAADNPFVRAGLKQTNKSLLAMLHHSLRVSVEALTPAMRVFRLPKLTEFPSRAPCFPGKGAVKATLMVAKRVKRVEVFIMLWCMSDKTVQYLKRRKSPK